ncbi:hypothetical protein THARTR1_00983 [Trichoderma harzianum]|uniref:Uncharacterized protein n=1 Tax=Trichoderma harzianum TaxID=5544 RepID=A0A2K0UNY1_TRIHA|nr:hypothetical protein THARTR1_00983 [Trichoderma harzianum]
MRPAATKYLSRRRSSSIPPAAAGLASISLIRDEIVPPSNLAFFTEPTNTAHSAARTQTPQKNNGWAKAASKFAQLALVRHRPRGYPIQ